jgi:hypothetical protein
MSQQTNGAAFLRLRSHSGAALFAAIAILLACSLSLRHALAKQAPQNDLTVHEWGTFTSVADTNGMAMDWFPLTGSTDLPRFVEHFSGAQFKGGLRGTVRMETPVLYFYALRQENVSVNVSFSRGLITEWYPHSNSVNPAFDPRRYSLGDQKSPGAISWESVHIDPQGSLDFPVDNSKSHYYAARQTASATVELTTASGREREKFLFYRGVSTFLPPVTATLAPDNTVQVQNHFPDPIPSAILFERRGVQLGYRDLGPLRNQASLAPPTLDGTLDSLFSGLEATLVSQGLFPDEAHAMLETWKDSWFEEGSRILYIVPGGFVNSVLPLNIQPVPSSTTRVFVGRVELVTPATEDAVAAAFATGDQSTLAKYSRFLDPILRTMIKQSADPMRQQQLLQNLNSVPRQTEVLPGD